MIILASVLHFSSASTDIFAHLSLPYEHVQSVCEVFATADRRRQLHLCNMGLIERDRREDCVVISISSKHPNLFDFVIGSCDRTIRFLPLVEEE